MHTFYKKIIVCIKQCDNDALLKSSIKRCPRSTGKICAFSHFGFPSNIAPVINMEVSIMCRYMYLKLQTLYKIKRSKNSNKKTNPVLSNKVKSEEDSVRKSYLYQRGVVDRLFLIGP